MPKPKGLKKKLSRPVVLPNLSDTEDPAPSPALASAPATAPADEVPGEPLVRSSPTGLEGLTQESASEPPVKTQKKQLRQLTHEEGDDMAEWLKSNPCLYNKKLEAYRKFDMEKHIWEEKVVEYANVDVDYLLGWYKSIRTRDPGPLWGKTVMMAQQMLSKSLQTTAPCLLPHLV